MNESNLRNNYLLMRHGESEANVSGVIVSDPATGCDRFGLTEQGLQQISDSAKGFRWDAITQIVCSDFLRTLQTAQLVAEILHLPQPKQEIGLRERFLAIGKACQPSTMKKFGKEMKRVNSSMTGLSSLKPFWSVASVSSIGWNKNIRIKWFC
jgi:broad specificity phosphatase PhoE